VIILSNRDDQIRGCDLVNVVEVCEEWEFVHMQLTLTLRIIRNTISISH